MKIIDLLNKIANGEEPPRKIKYSNEIFTYNQEDKNYENRDGISCDLSEYLILDNESLNEEVEIVEETQPFFKKIDGEWYVSKDFKEWLDNLYDIKIDTKTGVVSFANKKIEKLNDSYSIYDFVNEEIDYEELNRMVQDFYDKINEIIDKLNEEEE